MTVNLRKSLEQMEALVSNKNNSNLLIIKSHTLEILLSMSEDETFLAEVEQRDLLLETFLNSLDSPILRHKILLMFVNLSARASLANKLASLGVVDALYRTLFDIMKRVNAEHLDITSSLLVDKTSADSLSLGQTAQNQLVEEKKFEISQSKVKKEDQSKMLDLDCIKLAIMVCMNCSLFSSQARLRLLGLDTDTLASDQAVSAEKLRNFHIVVEWVNHERIGHLFRDFVFVVTNLSSDPPLRALLVEHSLGRLGALFAFLWSRRQFESYFQICQVFRNLSFEFEQEPLRDAFHTGEVIPMVRKSLDFEGFSAFQRNRLKLILVDLLWVFHTNIDFCQSDTPLIHFRYDGDKKQLEEWQKDKDLLALSEQSPDSSDSKEKLEGLTQLFANYSH